MGSVRESVLRSLRIYRGEICTKKRFVVSRYNDMWERLKVSFYKLAYLCDLCA